MRRVDVVAYREEWPFIFTVEAERIKQVLGENTVAIHHIGSTSVPGLKAKPIIDILPVVKDLGEVDRCNSTMQKIGYEPMGEFGIPGRRYFRKGKESRTHHIHVFQEGDFNIKRHLAFRDYLRTHPEERDRYGDLKEKLAGQYPFDVQSYMDGKDSVIKEMETEAFVWLDGLASSRNHLGRK